MVQTNFFPNVNGKTTKDSDGNIIYVSENSGLINEVATNSSFPNAYYLGYIKEENIPSDCNVTKVELKIMGGKLVFSPVTVSGACNVGFTSTYSLRGSSTVHNTQTGVLHYNGTNWENATGNPANVLSSMMLPNENTFNQLSIRGRCLTFVALLFEVDENSKVLNYATVYANLLIKSGSTESNNLITMEQMHDVIMNNASFKLDFITNIVGHNTLTLDFTMNDFAETGYCEKTSEDYKSIDGNNIKVFVICTGYNCATGRDFGKDGKVKDYSTFKMTIERSYEYNGEQIPIVFVGNSTLGCKYFSGSGEINSNGNNNTLTITKSTGVITKNNFNGYNNYCVGNFKGEIPLTFLTSYGYYPLDGGFAFWNNSSSMYVVPSYTTEDIRKRYCLQYRFSNTETINGTANYGVNKFFYYTKVTADNEFLAQLVTDATDENKAEKLQPFQYEEDIAKANEYNSDTDKPTSGDSDKDESTDTNDIIGNINRGHFPLYGLAGMTTFYEMNTIQMNEFAKILWSSISGDSPTGLINFFIGNSTNLQNVGTLDPSAILNCILSCRLYPFTPSDYTTHEATASISIGTGAYPYPIEHSIGLAKLTGASGFEIALGTCEVPEITGDFRDFSNTMCSIYLPFCGSFEVSPNLVIGKTLYCYYGVDVGSGACVGSVWTNDMQMICSGTGTIGFDVTLSATNAIAVEVSKARTATNMGSGMLSGAGQAITGAMSGSVGGALSGMQGVLNSSINGALNYIGGNGIAPSVINTTTNLSSLALPQQPYVTIRIPKYEHTGSMNKYTGKATYRTATIGSLSGFSQVELPDLDGLDATLEEKQMLANILASGFYA